MTDTGQKCQRRLLKENGQHSLVYDFPNVDWQLYGWVCYSHRAAIIKALVEPMQPATIKRKAKSQDPGLRMSANNVRDVIRLFLSRGIVQAIRFRKKVHPCYELTELGKKLQNLLLEAGSISK